MSSQAPSNLVVDEAELDRFLDWLPAIEPHQAYLLQLMIRSRGLKEEYGFKGTDHVLAFKAVHGYLDARPPDGQVYWRVRLKHEILRLGLLGAQGMWEYANYKPGSRDLIRHLIIVPWQLIAVYININPSDTLRAAQLTAKEVVDALAGMARSDGLKSFTAFFRRPDLRYYANLARSTKTRFHVVDVDDARLAVRVLELVEETLGYKPPVIFTHRGLHVIIDLERLRREGLENRYTGDPHLDMEVNGVTVAEALREYRARRGQRGAERYARVIEEYVSARDVPLFHRIKAMEELYRGEGGVPLVELKKQALEPVPGTLYKGRVVVRFDPGDG